MVEVPNLEIMGRFPSSRVVGSYPYKWVVYLEEWRMCMVTPRRDDHGVALSSYSFYIIHHKCWGVVEQRRGLVRTTRARLREAYESRLHEASSVSKTSCRWLVVACLGYVPVMKHVLQLDFRHDTGVLSHEKALCMDGYAWSFMLRASPLS